MDTKSKNNSPLGRIISAVALMLIAAALLLFGSNVYHRMRSDMPAVHEQAGFVRDIYNFSHALYWKNQQQEQGDIQLNPAELFFPNARQLLAEAEEAEGINAQHDWETLAEHSLLWVNQWHENFQNAWANFDYYIWNESTATGWGDENLKSLAQDSVSEARNEELRRRYSYYIQLHFDGEGKMSVPALYGADMDSVYTALQNYRIQDRFLEYTPSRARLQDSLQAPKSISFVFAIPAGMSLADSDYFDSAYEQALDMRLMGMEGAGLLAGALVIILALCMMRFRRREFAAQRTANLSFEVSLGLLLAAWIFYLDLSLDWMAQYFNGTFLSNSSPAILPAASTSIAGGLLTWVGVLLPLLACFMGALSLTQMRYMGFAGFFRQRSLIVRFFLWLKRHASRIVAWFTAIDMRDKHNRFLLKILLLNFLVVSLLCLLWAGGILGAIAYTVVLFVLIRKRTKDIKRQYQTLLEATAEMANGNLNVPMEEDLGIFEPVKDELQKVQQSFGEAVEAEVRSQKMKAELITNVSHDLKTPLTAIITYVDLLKNEDISPQDRRSYINTLAQKSQRLKELINDLFEVSKASSNTMVFHPEAMNIISLLKQVESEWMRPMEEAGLTLQNRFVGENLPVYLDGEKTSRIFENLLNNVCKYSLPNSRVYVEAEALGETIRVSIKNVSRDALDFDSEAITERFVRGDASRNTEGSGLGLAIVKGFTENQGGQFFIDTDGDLFKAIVIFPRQSLAEDQDESPTEYV